MISPAIIARYNEAHVSAEWESDGDELVAKRVSEILDTHYPGYLWGVHVGVREGVIDLLNFNLSGKHGYTIKLSGVVTHRELRAAVIRGAGELLERYNLPRARYDNDRYQNIPVDWTGLPTGETS